MTEGVIILPDSRDDQTTKEPLKQTKVSEGTDNLGRIHHESLTTLDKVKEEHIYLLYETTTKQIIVEADLLGEDTENSGAGLVPSSIHIECPECTTPSDRRILSIEFANKAYQIEHLTLRDQHVILMPDGETPVLGSNGKPAIQEKRLTIREKIQCTYPDCRARFKITDNIMQKL